MPFDDDDDAAAAAPPPPPPLFSITSFLRVSIKGAQVTAPPRPFIIADKLGHTSSSVKPTWWICVNSEGGFVCVLTF